MLWIRGIEALKRFAIQTCSCCKDWVRIPDPCTSFSADCVLTWLLTSRVLFQSFLCLPHSKLCILLVFTCKINNKLCHGSLMYVSMGGVSDCNISYISAFLFLLEIEQQYPEAFEVWIQLAGLFFFLLLTLLKTRTGTAGAVSRTRIRFVVQNLIGSLLHPLEKVPDNFMTLLVSNNVCFLNDHQNRCY